MHSDLDLLLKLQGIDYELGELERSKDYLPDMMENLKTEIDEVARRLTDTSERLEQARVTQKNLELEVKTKEQELAKYQQQMMSIKTNREYDALVAEIDNIKEFISSSETTLLETIELIATLEKEHEELTERQGSIAENNERQLQILQEKIDSIGEKVADKESTRQGVIDEITKPTLATYERVRKGRGNRAVVPIRKKACSSCFKALTPKRIQEIRRANRIYTCDYCGALLYWDDDISQ